MATAVLLSLSGVVLATPAAGQAVSPQDDSVQCDMGGIAAFSPAVSNTAAQSTMKLTVGKRQCVDDASEVASVTFEVSFTGSLSCTALPAGTSGKATYTWYLTDGSTDTSTANVHLTGASPQEFTIEGSIANGRYEAQSVDGEGSIDLAGAEGGCDADGVAEARMDGTFTVT
ncbi:hypothetical protein OG948_34815 (plasmid) [Embleya sp. NBC_00888]|uniref:hypothetical protein n=1 Tax=Embleya sp. NBC_00888 TaxID=2975960 RepID=UPI003866DCFD|nr:hypothetical protein OG948_34815 [Embleya sp. NBC_00888]